MFMVATVPGFFDFFRGQLKFLSEHLDITLVSSAGGALEEIGLREGVDTYAIPIRRNISPLRDLISTIRLIALFRREKPHIVHGNTPKGALVSMVAARVCGVPRRIYMCHGLRYHGARGTVKRLLMSMERIACRCATEVICVSESVMQSMNADRICPPDKMCVVMGGSSNGINIDRFDRDAADGGTFAMNVGIPDGVFVFCFVGRITRDKGIVELLEAFDAISHSRDDIWLLLVGGREDDVKGFPHRALKILDHHPRVICTGRLSDIRGALAVSDVFILPSYREGLGMAILEAGSMCVPSIAGDVAGCRDAVYDGVTGILVRPKDTLALRNAMERLLSDHRLREEMGRNARNYVMCRFDQKRLWEAYLQIYKG